MSWGTPYIDELGQTITARQLVNIMLENLFSPYIDMQINLRLNLLPA